MNLRVLNAVYHWLPLDRVRPRLIAALIAAEAGGNFSLHHHRRDHWHGKEFCQAIRSRAAAGDVERADLVDAVYPRDYRGPDNLRNEYFSVSAGRLAEGRQEDVSARAQEGRAVFERLFGRTPTHTVAPRYLWGPQAERAWRDSGMVYVHGMNRRHGPGAPHADMQRSRKLGFRSAEGLIGVPRNVPFDTSPHSGQLPDVARALDVASAAIEVGEPAVIETHSWNYYHHDLEVRQAMFQHLDDLLTGLEQRYPDLVYLSPRDAARLGEDGRVMVDGKELRAARRAGRAWLWAYGLYRDCPKFRYGAWGAAAMLAAHACPLW